MLTILSLWDLLTQLFLVLTQACLQTSYSSLVVHEILLLGTTRHIFSLLVCSLHVSVLCLFTPYLSCDDVKYAYIHAPCRFLSVCHTENEPYPLQFTNIKTCRICFLWNNYHQLTIYPSCLLSVKFTTKTHKLSIWLWLVHSNMCI